MIISNLTYTEFASEANNIEGGQALALAGAGALAAGPLFAATGTVTDTVAVVTPLGALAASASASGSFAI